MRRIVPFRAMARQGHVHHAAAGDIQEILGGERFSGSKPFDACKYPCFGGLRGDSGAGHLEKVQHCF
jgi:hypothetical protein